jgi:hypothetical protein
VLTIASPREFETTAMSSDESVFMFRHAGLMFVLPLVIITFANAAIWWSRGREEIAKNPALKWGYRRLVLRFLIYGNIPWVILCAAFELPPPFRVPLWIAFAITIVFYWIAGFYWIVFGGGAQELAAYPGLLRGAPRDPSTIKTQVSIILSLILVGAILVVSYLVSVAVPPILR